MKVKSYGQFCPVAKAAELFCEKWTPLIIRDLGAGATRFSELRRGVPLMSPSLLSSRLKQLEAEGIVERRTEDGVRSPTYHLTEAGTEFLPLVEILGVWGQRWSRRELAENEVDLGLLLWAIERSVDASALKSGRSVVRLELTDQPEGKRHWWFVNENDACELCLEDPGHEVDLYLACTLRDIIYVIRGDLALARAMEEDRLEAIGETEVRNRLADWLALGPMTQVTSVRADAAAV